MLGKIEGKRRRGRQRMRWLEVSITLILKPNKDIIRKENYRPIITLRNRDAKILKENNRKSNSEIYKKDCTT